MNRLIQGPPTPLAPSIVRSIYRHPALKNYRHNNPDPGAALREIYRDHPRIFNFQ